MFSTCLSFCGLVLHSERYLYVRCSIEITFPSVRPSDCVARELCARGIIAETIWAGDVTRL